MAICVRHLGNLWKFLQFGTEEEKLGLGGISFYARVADLYNLGSKENFLVFLLEDFHYCYLLTSPFKSFDRFSLYVKTGRESNYFFLTFLHP